MLNDKEVSILNSLYQWNRPTKIEELALVHKLSPRSIRSYVTRINNDFKFECITLKKGVFYISDQEFLTNFFQNYQVSNYSSQILVQFMLHKLLLENKINLSHFVIEFEVSRTTAKNYLNQVKEFLEEYHLKLDHSSGITLIGKELDKRQCLLNLFLDLEQRDLVELQLVQPLFFPYAEMVSEVLLQEFLAEMLGILSYEMSEHSRKILLYYLRIMVCRMKLGFPNPQVMNKQFLEKSDEFQATKANFQNLQEKLGVEIPLTESLEVINKIMGLHYSTDKEPEHHNWFEYDLFISKLIRRFSKACGYNLVGDFQLYENLLNHIKPAMYRIAHQIKLHQFDAEYIVEKSENVFHITETTLKDLHFYPREPGFYRDETALICVYFKQALEKEKSQEQKNVLLISNFGYGSSRMMMEKIRQHYHVGKMEWIPSQELKNMDKSQFQLVISTDSQIEYEESLPVVEISPFFGQEDRHKLALNLCPKEADKLSLSQILEVVERSCSVDDLSQLKADLLKKFPFFDDTNSKTGILEFMTRDMILLDVEVDSIQDVLEKSGELLESQGCIDGTYTENLIHSFENYGVYMMIDADVAIPHTKNTGNVKKTGFAFLRLSKPILFENHQLSMFFTFCTKNNKEHLEALVLIADIIKDETTKISMQTLSSPEEILSFLEKREAIRQ